MTAADVLLGRWQDVLPGAYDPARAVVVTDPPFGIGKSYSSTGDLVPWADHVREVLQLPATRHVIRGPSSLICRMDVPAPRRMCIEAADFRLRGRNLPGVLPHRWHAWLVYGVAKIGRRRQAPTGDVFRVAPYDEIHQGGPSSMRIQRHDGKTPWQSCMWAIETWVEPGMLVVDPFAGMGTLGMAAGVLGFDYLGAEVEPLWQEEALRSLAFGTPLRMDI